MPHTCGLSKGGPCRPEPGRPRPARFQASPDHRRRRDTLGGHADRRQSQRRHPAHPARRCPASDQGPAWSSLAPTSSSVCRPRLRPRQVSSASPGPRYHPGHRPPHYRSRLRIGEAPVAGRARIRMAARLQTSTDPLRTARRYPPGTTEPGLLGHLPPEAHSELISKGEAVGDTLHRRAAGAPLLIHLEGSADGILGAERERGHRFQLQVTSSSTRWSPLRVCRGVRSNGWTASSICGTWRSHVLDPT